MKSFMESLPTLKSLSLEELNQKAQSFNLTEEETEIAISLLDSCFIGEGNEK